MGGCAISKLYTNWWKNIVCSASYTSDGWERERDSLSGIYTHCILYIYIDILFAYLYLYTVCIYTYSVHSVSSNPDMLLSFIFSNSVLPTRWSMGGQYRITTDRDEWSGWTRISHHIPKWAVADYSTVDILPVRIVNSTTNVSYLLVHGFYYPLDESGILSESNRGIHRNQPGLHAMREGFRFRC